MNSVLEKIYAKPLIIVLVIFAVTLFFAFYVPTVEIDNDVISFLPESDPARQDIKESEELFGGALVIAVVVENPRSTVLTEEGIESMKVISSRLEELPGVEEVTSLATMDNIDGDEMGLVVEPFIDEQGPVQSPQLREKLASWEMYSKFIISSDYSAYQCAVVMVTGIEADEQEELYFSIEKVVDEELPRGYKRYISGVPAITVLISENIRRDLAVLIPFVAVLILGILYLSFGRLGGVLLPMATVIMSTIWTVGLMSLLHVPLSILGTIIPVLMMAVGSAYGIHIISHYYDHLGEFEDKSNRSLVIKVVSEVGQPVFLAGLTTLIGFGALCISSVIPMRDFGIFTAVGVLASIIIALFFIPSILLLRHHVLKGQRKSSSFSFGGWIEKLQETLSSFMLSRYKGIIAVTLLIFGASLYFMQQMEVDNAVVKYFKESTEIRKADDAINRKFAGTDFFDVIITSPVPGGVLHPDVLKAMDEAKTWLEENYPKVGKVVSYTDFIKRINQALHVGDPGEFALTPGTETVAAGADSGDFFGDGGESFFSGDSLGDDSSGAGASWGESFMEEEPSAGSFFDEDSGFSSEEEYSSSMTTTGYSATSDRLLHALFSSFYRLERGKDLEQFIDEFARNINYRGKRYYEIPHDPGTYGMETREELKDLISQYLLLFSGSLDSYSDDPLEPTNIRMTVYLNSASTKDLTRIKKELSNYIEQTFPGDVSVKISGAAIAQEALTWRLVESALRSISISVVLVFLVLLVTYRSLPVSLIGSFSIVLTILVNFGIMGVTGIALDISTAMVGSIAIGIGIDYVIHFLNAYSLGLKTRNTVEEAFRYAYRTTGKAVVFNALSVAAGFAVLGFSSFLPLMYLGLLIAITMAVSSLSALTVVPAMLYGFKIKINRNNGGMKK